MGKIVFGMISPHPPLLIPEIGGARIKDVELTDSSLDRAVKRLVSFFPDTVIIITPHGSISQSTVRVYGSPVMEGDFSMFGLKSVRISCKGDPALAEMTVSCCRRKKLLAETVQLPVLDHGIMVPLHYIKKAGYTKPVMPVAVSLAPLSELFDFGRSLADAVKESGKDVAVVASADMSHRLTEDAPSGYSPRGAVFDRRLAELVRENDVKGILSFDPELAEEAGQDALWSIAILLGALDGSGFRPEVLSYEGPFGVGYMVAQFMKGE